MDKFKTVIDGKVITQIATVGTYTYSSYTSGKGATGEYSWLIARVSGDGSERKYAVGSSVKKTYPDAWSDKAILSYAFMYQIKTGQ